MRKWTPESVMITLLRVVLVPVLAALFVLLLYSIRLVRHLDAETGVMDGALKSVQAIETNTTRTEAELSGLLNTTRHIAIDERNAQDKQLETVQELSTKTYSLLDDADNMVKQVSNLVPILADSIKNTTDDARVTMYSSQRLMEAATDDLSGPAIKDTLASIQDSSKNTAEVTKNMIGVTDDIHTETSLLVGKTKDAMKPRNKAISVLKFMLDGTLTGSELYYYIFR